MKHKRRGDSKINRVDTPKKKKKGILVKGSSKKKKKTKEKERKKRNSFVLNAKKTPIVELQVLAHVLVWYKHLRTHGRAHKSTIDHRKQMEEEGEKRQCYWCLLTRENERRPLKAEEKYQNLELQKKKKSHKSDLRLYELKTTNKVFLKESNYRFSFLDNEELHSCPKKKKNEHAHVPTPYTQVTQSKAPLHVYTFAQQVRKGGGKN